MKGEKLADPVEQNDPATPENTPSGDQNDVTPSSSDGLDEQSSFLDALTKASETSSSEEPQPETEEPAEEPPSEEPEAEASAEEAPKEDETPTDDEPEEEVLSEEPSKSELKAMSARTKRRVEQLLSERKEARVEAEKARPITKFMAENDIPMQDVDVVLGMAAQLRHGDFAGFLRTVQPYVNLAQQYVGAVLPPDLQKQVEQGYVSEPVAKELAQRRVQEQVSRQQAERQQQAQESEVRNLRGQAIRSAVQQWEETTKSSDPDYEAKADIVRRTAQALMAERGVPQSPEQALEYVKEAYSEANKVVTRLRPRPKATQAQPSSVNQTSKSPAPEPQSMFDVVRQSVGG